MATVLQYRLREPTENRPSITLFIDVVSEDDDFGTYYVIRIKEGHQRHYLPLITHEKDALLTFGTIILDPKWEHTFPWKTFV